LEVWIGDPGDSNEPLGTSMEVVTVVWARSGNAAEAARMEAAIRVENFMEVG